VPFVTRLTGRWRIAVIALGIVVVAVAGVSAHGWYYDHYVWPRKIQLEVLGEVIVDHTTFLSFEDTVHWGQGFYRWKFAAPRAPGSAWMKYCGSKPTASCEFVLPGNPEARVETSVSYKDGVITIEEWWM
jgi:hypothetical protein